jgi:prepilin-type N-terminal cleavage/methylation domain-containing protein
VKVIGLEDGYTAIEMLVVMVILGVVMGGIIAIFVSGLNADADSTRRYQDQQDARVSVVRMTREVHAACSVSTPNTYNTWMNTATFYFPTYPNGVYTCVSGATSVTWCTKASGSFYALYRGVGTTCAAATVKYADFVTASNVFVYLPPNSHLVTPTATTLGAGTAGTNIATQDNAWSLPRLHVAFTVDRGGSKHVDKYTLVDDITFRNGPRTCAGVATC